MNPILCYLAMSLLSVSAISTKNLLRRTRSITNCPEVIVSNFSSARLQVFLTVNSKARVFWDGTFEKRRLELNWVTPPDREDGDYVGLFRDDPHGTVCHHQ